MKQRQWIYTSKETGERFAVKELSGDTESGQQLLAVHTGRKRQQILGFGGAFTDTSAMALMHMSPELQEEALTAYFDTENGLGYNMGRVPVGGPAIFPVCRILRTRRLAIRHLRILQLNRIAGGYFP